MTSNNASRELVLIDAGVQRLQDIPMSPHLQSLSLHFNHIRKIECLDDLRHLKHLDLSSNQISKMEGLGQLTSLKTLNLSSNSIRKVEGLRGLRLLKRLVIAYNQIDNLSGLRGCTSLTHLQLQGNRLAEIDHAVACLESCTNLSELHLAKDSSGNPLCSLPGYRSELLNRLPQLSVLDGRHRNGQRAQSSDPIADIPGLEEYLEILVSSDRSSADSQENPMDLAFPRIEKALEQFRKKAVTSSDLPSTSELDTTPEADSTSLRPSARNKEVGKEDSSAQTLKQEERLKRLEKQLADLLKKKQHVSSSSTSEPDFLEKNKEAPEIRSTTDVIGTDGSETDFNPKEVVTHASKKSRPTTSALPVSTKRKVQKSKQPPPQVRGQKQRTPLSSSGPDASTLSARGLTIHHQQVPRRTVTTTVAQDSDKLSLMQELDIERERRWKAEQAARKLADDVKDLQSKVYEERELQEITVQATARLKQALMNRKEEKVKMENLINELKVKAEKAEKQFEIYRIGEEKSRKALREMEATLSKLEVEKLQQHAHEVKKTQEYQMKAAAEGREAELLRALVKQNEGKIQQLQELMAEREHEYRQQLSNRYSLNDQEVQNVVTKELIREQGRYKQETKIHAERYSGLKRQHMELEDEFRMALQIEANRFLELQKSFDQVSEENSRNKQALQTAIEKEKKSSDMVGELNSMVKEQKGRITELIKSRQESTVDLRERVQILEAHLDEARRRMVQMELLKQEVKKLQTDLSAKESLVEGLRAEKKIWGQELAQQGASLAQDRGRLEARIQALEAEITSLKKQSERDNDTLKIKTKILDDQTDSIRNLKDGIVERDEELKRVRDEFLQTEKELKDHLVSVTDTLQDSERRVEHLTERKDELKQYIQELQTELDENKRALSVMNSKWTEKSELISKLEMQVKQAKASFEEKERLMKTERDKAVESEKAVVEKLRSIDEAFQKQLDLVRSNHEEELHQLISDKQKEIDKANRSVLQVEDEMRQLLIETNRNKKVMEEKVKRLTNAFSDLHEGFN